MFGLTYHRAYRSNLIPFAVAVSGKFNSGRKTKLTPLRLTNVGGAAASISFDNSFNGRATTLQYRRDEQQAFVDWDLSTITIAPGEYVEFVGENYNTQGFLGRYHITGESVAASGNIMSLIYGEKTAQDFLVIPEGIRFSDGSYYGMFSDCTCLTSAPSMPATTLTEWCYAGMFSGCSSLVTPPVLPATILKTRCYYKMFDGCSSLTTAPELPATTLAAHCYGTMFSDCTSLTDAPELPATTLAESCYGYMFFGCTSLTVPPALPAIELATYCYGYMFQNCTSLTYAPGLPATTLADWCYASMFYGCTSLKTAPELPATILAYGCYSGMFVNCSDISAVELPATELLDECYASMFNNCTSLTSLIVGFSEWLYGATSSWLERVDASGTFTCPSDLDTTQRGADYIPEGWNVVTV